MGPKYGGGNKCDRCQKTVYPAEQIEAGDRYYHKFCFKCSECQLQLKRENYAQADGELFCKKHFSAIVVAQNTQPTNV